MISKKAKYALKALTRLALNYETRKPLLISEISESENIPKKFLEAILLELRNNGILQSQKGKGGGYLLKLQPSEVKIARVIRVIDGPIAPLLCVSLNFYDKCEDCSSEEACRIRPMMQQIRDANLKVYENTTLSDLANNV
ncbi:MAG: Rrf2 family transcriptional regulator [Leadbetterella sp.]|nr:Rrf2 family transcriptional regulator [Leadbetterella sp.]